MESAAASRDSPLWAVTCYFNPVPYRRRLTNYRIFRERLTVPLAAVELCYRDEFELGPSDAEVLIQFRGTDVLWQKERLLNVALAALPAACRAVAWLDCDVLFDRPDWPTQTCRLLERYPLVQLFRTVGHLSRDWSPTQGLDESIEYTQQAIASAGASGLPVYRRRDAATRGWPGENSRGLAWAARRELLEAHGFYDGCIVGGGDSALVLAAYGLFDDAVFHLKMNERQQEHFLNWARPFHSAVRGTVTFRDGELYHLWHGQLEHRRYGVRLEELRAHAFDPFSDIGLAPNGCWRWTSDRPSLHQYLREYFAGRKEDG